MLVDSDQDEKRKADMQNLIKSNASLENRQGKIVNQSRITRFGKFLRKYSLDELPQLFNVLKGEMSLVGPRPCLPYEFDVYDEWHKKRLEVKPGCTGLWQVSTGGKGNFDDSVVLDLYYNQNISLWYDMQLILKTLPVMLKGMGDD